MSFLKKFIKLFSSSKKQNNSMEEYDLKKVYDDFIRTFDSKYSHGDCKQEYFKELKKEEIFIPVGDDFNKKSEHGFYVLYLGKTPFVKIKRTAMGGVTGKGYFFLPTGISKIIFNYACERLKSKGLKQSDITQVALKDSLNDVIYDMARCNMSKKLYDEYIQGSEFGVGSDNTHIECFSMAIDKQPLVK